MQPQMPTVQQQADELTTLLSLQCCVNTMCITTAQAPLKVADSQSCTAGQAWQDFQRSAALTVDALLGSDDAIPDLGGVLIVPQAVVSDAGCEVDVVDLLAQVSAAPKSAVSAVAVARAQVVTADKALQGEEAWSRHGTGACSRGQAGVKRWDQVRPGQGAVRSLQQGICIAFEPGRVQPVQPAPRSLQQGAALTQQQCWECELVWPALALTPPCYLTEAYMASGSIAGSQHTSEKPDSWQLL